jgi:hypothetical protein
MDFNSLVTLCCGLMVFFGAVCFLGAALLAQRARYDFGRARIERRHAQHQARAAKAWKVRGDERWKEAIAEAKRADEYRTEVRNQIAALYGLPAEKTPDTLKKN